MKILVCAHSFFPEATGVAQVATKLSLGLKRLGHSVMVATGRRASQVSEIPLDIVEFQCGGNYVTGLRGEVDTYIDFVRRDDSDVLVLHCAQSWCLDALLDYLGQLRKPVILISHGLSGYRNLAYAEYFKRLAEKLRPCGHIVGLSELLEEPGFCRLNGLPLPTIIPNGVDLPEWAGALLDVRELWNIGSRPWVVSVSNHSTVKNHRAFWKVLKELGRKVPEVKGTIVGGSYRAARCRAGRFGVKGGCWYKCCARSWFSHRVSLKDDAARAEVVSAIRESNLLLVTSSREAAPLVILESMAAGVPWISFRVGSVEDNIGGIIVDSMPEMVRASQRILADKEEAAELGRLGRERVHKRHDWSVISDEHQKLYKSIIANYKARN